LIAGAENMERFTCQHFAEPLAQKAAAWSLDVHSWTIGVCEAKNGGAKAVVMGIEEVELLRRHFVDPVDVDGAKGVVFRHRQVRDAAVDLPGACKDDMGALRP
jgi:hypothetical protein